MLQKNTTTAVLADVSAVVATTAMGIGSGRRIKNAHTPASTTTIAVAAKDMNMITVVVVVLLPLPHHPHDPQL